MSGIPQRGCDRPALKLLNKYVRKEVSRRWHDLGLELLELEDEEMLNIIETNNSFDVRICCKEMFQLWLRKYPNPTWNQLIQALKEVELNNLAATIEGMLIPTEDTVSASAVPAKSSSDTAAATTTTSITDFSDCPDIPAAFALLTGKITKLLKKADFKTLRRTILQHKNVPKGVQFPDDLCQSIKIAQDLDTLLDLLADSKHWSWVDLRLIESLIMSSDICEANVLVNKYKEIVFSKKLSEVLKFMPKHEKHKGAYISKVGSKIEKNADEMTVADLSEYSTILEAVIMDINKGSCVLEHLDTGCLEIHWLIPAHCRFHAYKSALSNRHKFADIQLQYLHIEPYPPIYNPFTIQPTLLSTLLHLPKPIASTPAEVISHYYCFLADNLNNSVVCQVMLELKLLTERDLMHCAKMYSDHQQNAYLLDRLLVTGTASIDDFCRKLRSTKSEQEVGSILVAAIESIPADDVVTVIDEQSSGTSSQPTSSDQDDTVITPEVFVAAKTVHTDFLKLVSQLQQELKDYDPESFLAACNKLTASASHVKAIPLIPSDYLEDLCNSGIEEIFTRLAFVWTWNNHSILRALLKACDCQEGIKMLDDFNSKIDTNQPIELFPIPPPSMKMAPSLSSAYTVLSIRHEYDQDELTSLQYVNNVAAIMIEKFGISSHALQLIAARTTPLMLYWMIPKSVVPLISKGVNRHLKFLEENGFSEIGIYPNIILFANYNLNSGLFSLLSDQSPSTSAVEEVAFLEGTSDGVQIKQNDYKDQAMDVEQPGLVSTEFNNNGTVAEYYRIVKTHEINFVRTHEDNFITFLSNQLAKLKTLSVNGCNITDKGKELIKAFVTKSTVLQIFDMSNAKLSTIKASEIVGVFALTKTAAIQSLDISRNCITADYLEDLISALAQCNTLENLNLSHNLLIFTSIIAIAEGLRGHHNLKNLDLSENLISFHSEAEFLVDVILSTSQSLVYLNICGRNIRPRFSNDHLFPPPNTKLQSTRFPLQNLYLSRLPSFDMFTFKSREMDVPENFIEAKEESCPMLDKKIVSYYVDHDGGTFYNQDHDFAIVIPPGAVLQGDCVEIRATASLFGPYQFPNGYNPVSSFFWASSDYTFKIPVYLIMSHYAVIKNVDDVYSLCVLQACKHDVSITNEGKLMMTEILNGVHFDCDIRYYVLKTQHFCSFSAQEKSEGILSKWFKVFCYEYKLPCEDNFEQYLTEVCFCPDNCDCSKVIEMQCSKNHGKMLPYTNPSFDFAKGQVLYIPNDFSGISGWFVSQTGNKVVSYDHFKDRYSEKDAQDAEKKLQEAKEKCQYPPRLQIQCTRFDSSVNLRYSFEVKKKTNKTSESVGEFPLLKAAIGTMKGQKSRPTDDPPTIKQLQQLMRDAPISEKWYEIGVELLGNDIALRAFKASHPSDVNRCCQEMFRKWLDVNPGANWCQLVTALNKIGLRSVAVSISKQYMLVNFSVPSAGKLLHTKQSEEETRKQVQKYHAEKRPLSFKRPRYDHSSGEQVQKYHVVKRSPSSSQSKRPRHDHFSGSSHGGYDSRPPPQGGSSYQSWGSSSYHHSQGNFPYQSQGDYGYRGSGSGGYQDSYGYRDSPPHSRDFGDFDQSMWSGEGYRPPHPRSMEPSPAHYYDRYPAPRYYDRGLPPPPHGYTPPPQERRRGGGY